MKNQHATSTRQRHRAFTSMKMGGLFAAGAIVLAACGGGGGKTAAGSDMAGMDMGAQPGNTASASTPVATDAVHITNFAFSPATITVKAGSTVVWTNDDSIQHDITFDGGDIASNDLNHNDTFSHTFPTAGTFHYICSIHPFMHGTVIVTA
jgi:plastocyanin